MHEERRGACELVPTERTGDNREGRPYCCYPRSPSDGRSPPEQLRTIAPVARRGPSNVPFWEQWSLCIVTLPLPIFGTADPMATNSLETGNKWYTSSQQLLHPNPLCATALLLIECAHMVFGESILGSFCLRGLLFTSGLWEEDYSLWPSLRWGRFSQEKEGKAIFQHRLSFPLLPYPKVSVVFVLFFFIDGTKQSFPHYLVSQRSISTLVNGGVGTERMRKLNLA